MASCLLILASTLWVFCLLQSLDRGARYVNANVNGPLVEVKADPTQPGSIPRMLLGEGLISSWSELHVGKVVMFRENVRSGWKVLEGFTDTVTLDIWKFDTLSLTWMEVKNTFQGPMDLLNSSFDASYLVLQKTLIINPTTRLLKGNDFFSVGMIVCNVRESPANCENAVVTSTKEFPALFLLTDVISGEKLFFIVGHSGKSVMRVIVYSICDGITESKYRLETQMMTTTLSFAGVSMSTRRLAASILLAPRTQDTRVQEALFFGSSISLLAESDTIRNFLESPMFTMPVWILRCTRTESFYSPQFKYMYTILYPSPGPRHPRRHFHTVTLVTNKTAILYGGFRSKIAEDADPKPWCFNVHEHFWVEANITSGKVPSPRRQHVSFRHNRSAMVIHGGRGKISSHALGDLWMFVITDEDQCKGGWYDLTGYVKKGHLPIQYGHSVTPTDHGVLLFGGKIPSDSKLVLVEIRPTSEITIRDIPILPEIPNRYSHSLSFVNSDLIMIGGRQTGGTIRGVPNTWSLLIAIRSNGSHEVATWNKFFKMRIWNHFVLGDMVIGGSGQQAAGWESKFHLLNTYNMCPIGLERGEKSQCQPCPIGKYSPSLAQQCIKCNQSLTTVGEAASHCVPEGPCKDNTCNRHGECLVNKADFKHICVCRFGYLPSDDCNAPAVYLILMASLVFATTLTTLVIALIQFLRKRRALNAKEIELVNTNRDLYRSNRKLSQINHGTCIAWSDLKIQRQLSEGRFCKVLLAELGDMAVVVKRLPPFVSTASPYDSFIQEAEVLRTLSHPNIVLFLGAGKDSQSRCPFLVMEYLMRGSLCDVLHDPSNKIDHPDRLRFTLDAARGVRYLHNRDPPMIHRDIKSANMLVSDKWVVKIGDMETARFLAILHLDGIGSKEREAGFMQTRDNSTRTVSDTTHPDQLTTPLLGATSVTSDVDHIGGDRATRAPEGMTSRIGMTCGVGTDRWRSPESIKKNLYTEKHDVYSFGVVMWELSTRQIPYARLSNSDDILDEIAGGTKPIFPPNIPYGYRHIAEQCIKTDLQERPSMQRIVQELLSQTDGN
ncbi:uncharacterized protein LOC135822915 isoform X2 [Sycon ciliatum]|uniref:uncharacterized protein LOC135822915 isoform X2 n=1 Tax=Sycon ciliatum TaxID=27933 RepID=UPI0031F6C93E